MIAELFLFVAIPIGLSLLGGFIGATIRRKIGGGQPGPSLD
ncbi:hypothetical protein BH18GEM1_BH18GEM1_04080 [soil metagenome]